MFSLGVSSEEASALLLRWLCLVQDKFCVCVPAWRAALEELGETSSCVGAQNQLPNNNVKLFMLWHKHGKVGRSYPQNKSPDLEAVGSCHPRAARGWVLAVLCCLGHLPGK